MEKINIKNVFILMSKSDEDAILSMLKEEGHEEIRKNFHLYLATDEDGFITEFTPGAGMTWGLIFFIQNLMIMQRLSIIDDFIKNNGSRK